MTYSGVMSRVNSVQVICVLMARNYDDTGTLYNEVNEGEQPSRRRIISAAAAQRSLSSRWRPSEAVCRVALCLSVNGRFQTISNCFCGTFAFKAACGCVCLSCKHSCAFITTCTAAVTDIIALYTSRSSLFFSS